MIRDKWDQAWDKHDELVLHLRDILTGWVFETAEIVVEFLNAEFVRADSVDVKLDEMFTETK